ncbi:MAG TPA: hypothetical protein VK427_01300, partial [Kofleriaceae bacterium]|nr:hypothetical protein [Kofleriaceae bacterium]
MTVVKRRKAGKRALASGVCDIGERAFAPVRRRFLGREPDVEPVPVIEVGKQRVVGRRDPDRHRGRAP